MTSYTHLVIFRYILEDIHNILAPYVNNILMGAYETRNTISSSRIILSNTEITVLKYNFGIKLESNWNQIVCRRYLRSDPEEFSRRTNGCRCTRMLGTSKEPSCRCCWHHTIIKYIYYDVGYGYILPIGKNWINGSFSKFHLLCEASCWHLIRPHLLVAAIKPQFASSSFIHMKI